MSARERRRPPRLAEWLVARVVRDGERAMVLGDLREEFDADASAAGFLRAWLGYWRGTLRLAWGMWWWAPPAPRRRPELLAFDDVRYAARRLRKRPLAVALSVATLAGAIGAAAATWSLVSAVLLHPLDVHDPDRLVAVVTRSGDGSPRGPRISPSHNYPTYRAVDDVAPMPLAAWGSIGSSTPLMVQTTAEPVRRSVRYASHDLLDVLGVAPAIGRFFTADDDRRGAPLVAVLSDRFWRREFEGDPSVIGRIIRVRDHQVEIVGVGPRGFRGLEVAGAPDLFLPLHAIDRIDPYTDSDGRDLLFTDRPPVHWIHLVGRLPDGLTAEQMSARFNALDVLDRGSTFVLNDAATAALSAEARTTVTTFSRLLGATVALLLAIGSLTVGMLLVLRTDARRAEIAMCLALGASRGRLAAGVCVEALLLALAGAAIAAPVSRLLFAGIDRFQLPGGIRVSVLELSVDWTVLAGTAAAAIVSVLLMAAVVSVLGVWRAPNDVLRSTTGATPRTARRWPRSALVTAQVAVTLVLVTGAGLFARSVARALSLNPGIDTSRLIRADVNVEAHGYDPHRAVAFYETLRSTLMRHPAIATAAIESAPFGTSRIDLDGRPVALPKSMTNVWVGDGYFETLRLQVSRGRLFTGDDRAGGPSVGVITASLARELVGAERATGRRIAFQSFQDGPQQVEIVGVVPDFVWSVGLNPFRLYRPAAQQPIVPTYAGGGGRDLIVRAAGDVSAAMQATTDTVRLLDARVHLSRMATAQSGVLDAMAPQRFGMTVMGTLGAIALLLSILGIWGLAESMAAARRRELGIRAALGARGHHLRRLLLSETFRLVGLGLLLGFGLSWLGAGTIRGFLFQVEPFDPLVTGSVAGVIVGLALAVSLRSALSASRLDLARQLRED
jgi:predicted permease